MKSTTLTFLIVFGGICSYSSTKTNACSNYGYEEKAIMAISKHSRTGTVNKCTLSPTRYLTTSRPAISLDDIVGIYQADTDVIDGVHIYLMLNKKMVFITAQGSGPGVLSNPKSWMKTGTFKIEGNKIVFSYGKTFHYVGKGIIDAGSFQFRFLQSL